MGRLTVITNEKLRVTLEEHFGYATLNIHIPIKDDVNKRKKRHQVIVKRGVALDIIKTLQLVVE